MAKKKDLDMVSSSAKVKLGASDIIVRGIGYFVTSLYSLACIFPFLVILGSSFSSESYLNLHGFHNGVIGFRRELARDQLNSVQIKITLRRE